MQTRNQTIKNATDNYLSNFVITSVDDIKNIEPDLLNEIYDEFDNHNILCPKDERWKKPQKLEYWQISEILQNCFSVKIIHENDSKKSDKLGILIDTNIAYILNDNSLLNTYATDDKTLYKIIQYFDRGISITSCKRIIKDLERNIF